ncbi:hypothetical protein C7999DRAFT_40094 [Corynascus novoguineensis]|uniref:CCD97-like C-terminal domain-containing protein n=1 Tax=Corynascus novoguineensis TaxID=1126955 RepID=A0AAN7CUQ3_9PEZI|nr:hypothetical protein C7999DRAFT_40094 [Corynascus novoguineensis]
MAPRFDSPPSTPHSFSQPRPRPPRSPGRSAQIRAQNRRRAYLERHNSYFQSSEHELSDPLLYDFLIRRFQTPAEREAEGRAKGYARVLEGSLLRGEERLAKLRERTLMPPPKTREEGLAQWEAYLRDRFIRGEDDDFDYALVDDDDEYDVLDRVDREEAWFEEEDPEWATSGEEGERGKEKILRGETGVQDY